MGRLAAAMLVAAALFAVPVAYAADIGANDDTGKFAGEKAGTYYERVASLGLRQSILTVRWQPSRPDVIPDEAFLDQAIPAAVASGVNVVFAVYPYPPRELRSGLAGPSGFARFVENVALRYPVVRQFVIGNEPNQSAFWRPQMKKNGAVRSAAAFGRYLAAGYDALKALDPDITVIGVGLSPRGNDNPRARSNLSTSPVRFISALGAWYRKSGRTRPLMDGFSYHPYPRTAKHGLMKNYPWPHAGFRNLDRVKQALWDAFAGTAQPTTLDGLGLYLDEVGWQVDTSYADGYTGAENVAVTSEGRQAAVYGNLVRRAACDPDIAEVNFFGFQDDAARTGFQAALYRLDGTPRASAGSVSRAIISTSRGCTGKPVRWRPAKKVIGASAAPWRLQRSGAIKLLIGAKEGARAVVCLVRAPAKDVRAVATVSALQRRAVGSCWRGTVTPRMRREVKLLPPATVGPVTVVARFFALANPKRVSLLLPKAKP